MGIHILCVACLGEEHAQSARETAGWEHCNVLPLRTLRSRVAFFREDAQARVPQFLGFAKGSVSGGRDRHRIISAFTWHVQCLVSGLGSTRCGFFRPGRGTHTLQLSDSEELDVVSANVRGTGLATSVSCLWGAGWGCDVSGWEIKYWFASRVRTFVQKANLTNTSRAQPQRRGLPFFPDLHTEMSRSWEKLVSYRVNSTQTSMLSEQWPQFSKTQKTKAGFNVFSLTNMTFNLHLLCVINTKTAQGYRVFVNQDKLSEERSWLLHPDIDKQDRIVTTRWTNMVS